MRMRRLHRVFVGLSLFGPPHRFRPLLRVVQPLGGGAFFGSQIGKPVGQQLDVVLCEKLVVVLVSGVAKHGSYAPQREPNS